MLLQIQSVIYGNEKSSLERAIKAICQAVKVCHTKGMDLQVKLIYGDASPEPVFNEVDLEKINNIIGKQMAFEYRVFGFNSGTAKGHNLMGKNSNSDYMMIMNPDVIVEPQCIMRLIGVLEACDNIGMVEARQTPLEHAKEYDLDTGETEWASTACTIFRTNVFNEIDGFDEDTFFLYCDDLDFSWRVRLGGYRIIYVPSAIVYHAKELSIDGGWKPTNAEQYYSAEAAMLLAYKWSNETRANYLCELFTAQGGASEKKAAEEYRKRQQDGHLPMQLDSDHKIAKFIKNDYCKMRFYYYR